MIYAKALVPLAIGAIFTVIEPLGFTPDMRLEDAILFILTAGLVWLVPNRKA